LTDSGRLKEAADIKYAGASLHIVILHICIAYNMYQPGNQRGSLPKVFAESYTKLC
jgi:hypothetical protein